MALKFNSIKCPECGANLPIEEGRDTLFCSYCGNKIIVTNMYASSNRSQFARNLLLLIVECEIQKRKHIEAPSDEQMVAALKDVLEDISDNCDLVTT